MIKKLIDIDQLLEDTKVMARNSTSVEYIPIEIDRLLNETSDTRQMH